MKRPIAILTSDWHIWGRPPLWRSAEPDWFSAMGRPIQQIRRYQKRNNDIPVFIAGDIFDFYNPTPETINWLLRRMPKNVYAIPGQHDLQNHVYDLVEKTGFWTLKEAGVITSVDPQEDLIVETFSGGPKIQLVGRPWQEGTWGEEPKRSDKADVLVLLEHKYIYKDASTCFHGANSSCNISNAPDFLKGIDVAVFGDNHIPFVSKFGKARIVNCGTMLRRKIDEREYAVGFTVLFDDLSIERVPFDTDKDRFVTITIEKSSSGDRQEERAAKLLKELEELDTISIDFEERVTQHLEEKHYPKSSKQMMLEIFNKFKESKK